MGFCFMEGSESHLLTFLEEELHERLPLVLHAVVEDCVLQCLLEGTHLARWLESEELHDLIAVDDGL